MDISSQTATDLDNLIEAYQELREKCYRAARANDGELMGDDAWLRFAMSESDLELAAGPEGISVWGSCHSAQTNGHEHFNFFLPWAAL